MPNMCMIACVYKEGLKMNNQLKILKKEFDNHSKSFNTAIIYLENEEVKQDYFNFLHKMSYSVYR